MDHQLKFGDLTPEQQIYLNELKGALKEYDDACHGKDLPSLNHIRGMNYHIHEAAFDLLNVSGEGPLVQHSFRSLIRSRQRMSHYQEEHKNRQEQKRTTWLEAEEIQLKAQRLAREPNKDWNSSQRQHWFQLEQDFCNKSKKDIETWFARFRAEERIEPRKDTHEANRVMLFALLLADAENYDRYRIQVKWTVEVMEGVIAWKREEDWFYDHLRSEVAERESRIQSTNDGLERLRALDTNGYSMGSDQEEDMTSAGRSNTLETDEGRPNMEKSQQRLDETLEVMLHRLDELFDTPSNSPSESSDSPGSAENAKETASDKMNNGWRKSVGPSMQVSSAHHGHAPEEAELTFSADLCRRLEAHLVLEQAPKPEGQSLGADKADVQPEDATANTTEKGSKQRAGVVGFEEKIIRACRSIASRKRFRFEID